MHHKKTTSLLLCAMFTALICIGAFIRIPTPLVPLSMQLWCTTMAGMLLGPKLGAVSVLVYVLLGLIGVPVFTMGGGIGYVLQPTFGYLIGFIIGTWLTGVITRKKEEPGFKWLLLAAFAGMFAVYIIGTAYCYFISRFVLGTGIAFWPLFISCFILPFPGDAALC
ncbi:MAG: biotin transporter BioY, partial [Peptococcaceae bacterium]|nr:biotin transporter BioY [Peptococcaceae bacterium]